jgi:hypothetical protein
MLAHIRRVVAPEFGRVRWPHVAFWAFAIVMGSLELGIVRL